jgi:putative ABC transport system permease protein
VLNFFIENVRAALRNLRRHKLRTLLTALGIIFGITAVIVMVAIGEGSKRQALRQLQQLGSNNIVVRSVRPPEGSDSATNARILVYGLKETDFLRLQTLPGVSVFVPVRDTEKSLQYNGRRFPQSRAIATSDDFFRVVNLQIERGQLLTAQHMRDAAPVCVLGAEAARQIFVNENPLGQSIECGTPSTGSVILRVIGILEPTGLRPGEASGITDRDIDRDIYLPITLSQQVFGKTTIRRMSGSTERKQIEYSEIWAQVINSDDVEQTAEIFKNVVGLPARQDVQVKAPIEILRAAEQTNRRSNFVLGGIASLSLLVGGIGIMNIMLASVTERTREIGIRRALGAKKRHITLQFLIETTALSQAGGLVGIALGTGVALALPYVLTSLGFESQPTAIAPWSVIAAFVVSGGIGMFFGLYPAISAANMNPIQALRHE